MNYTDSHPKTYKSMNKEALRLYLVTDRALSLGRTLEEIVAEAVSGGATMVQLREKETPTGEFIDLALRLKAILKPLGIPLIINDRVDVALAADADGVHIGQSDMPYAIARKLLGPDKIIGLSVENLEDLLAVNSLDVDYVGISPVYATPTKRDTAPAFGIEGLKEAVRLSLHPTVAIGGMNRDTAEEVMQTGCDGIAVVSAISSAPSPSAAARELRGIADSSYRKSWCQEVWQASSKIYSSILGHEFIKELSDGTLPVEKFALYIAQDEIYLKSYYRDMLTLADIMESPEEKELFKSIAISGMEGEKAMHDLLINRYSIETCIPESTVTRDYTETIRKGVESGDQAIALAAILPCMWIYNRVGLHILGTAKEENNPYKEWILEYGNEELSKATRTVLDIIDAWARKAGKETREKMTFYYLKGALYEFAFWDYAYYGEKKSYDYTKSLEEWI